MLLNQVTSIGMLIDTPYDTLENYLNNSGLNVTGLTNIKKALELEYERVTYVKDCIIKRVTDGEITKEQSETTLQELYKVLGRIEMRTILLARLINGRKLTN